MVRRPPAAPGSPFQALRDLKTRPAPAKNSPTPQPQVAATPLAPAAAEEDMASLLAEAFAGTTPMAADNRAQLKKAPPAPRPRPRTVEETLEPTPPRPRAFDPNDPAALFQASVGDVTPIKDGGRAEVGPRLSRQKRRAQAAEAKAGPDTLEAFLADLPDNDPTALFRRAVGGTTPLPDKNQADIDRPRPPPRPRPQPQPQMEEIPKPSAGQPAPPPLSDRADAPAEGDHLRPGAPGRLLADLRRGRITVETEIDLHGYTRDEAREFLTAALARCGRRGQRCLRIIHGKGLSSPGGESLLKNLTRNWLAQHPEVLAFCEAKPGDGGSGALLVLLRNPNREGGAGSSDGASSPKLV